MPWTVRSPGCRPAPARRRAPAPGPGGPRPAGAATAHPPWPRPGPVRRRGRPARWRAPRRPHTADGVTALITRLARATGHHEPDRSAQHDRQGVLDGALDGAQPRLHRPPGEPGPVVGQVEAQPELLARLRACPPSPGVGAGGTSGAVMAPPPRRGVRRRSSRRLRGEECVGGHTPTTAATPAPGPQRSTTTPAPPARTTPTPSASWPEPGLASSGAAGKTASPTPPPRIAKAPPPRSVGGHPAASADRPGAQPSWSRWLGGSSKPADSAASASANQTSGTVCS